METKQFTSIIALLFLVVLISGCVQKPVSILESSVGSEVVEEDLCIGFNSKDCLANFSCRALYVYPNQFIETPGYSECVKLSDNDLETKRELKNLCENTGGNFAADMYNSFGKCHCFSPTSRYIRDEGCLDIKRECEKSGGTWKEQNDPCISSKPLCKDGKLVSHKCYCSDSDYYYFRCPADLSVKPLEPIPPEEPVTQSSSNKEGAVATLGLYYGNVSSGQIDVYVDLDPSQEEISAIQLDINFDSSIVDFKSVEISATAKEADKTLAFNEVESGLVRVIIYGINQNLLPKGSVARFTFDLLVYPWTTQKPNFILDGVVASSPQAESVPLSILGVNTESDKEQVPQTISSKEKCEQSGGKWTAVECAGASGACKYACNCLIGGGRRIAVDGICRDCISDEDCARHAWITDVGSPRRIMGHSFVCNNGICEVKE